MPCFIPLFSLLYPILLLDPLFSPAKRWYSSFFLVFDPLLFFSPAYFIYFLYYTFFLIRYSIFSLFFSYYFFFSSSSPYFFSILFDALYIFFCCYWYGTLRSATLHCGYYSCFALVFCFMFLLLKSKIILPIYYLLY